MTRYLNIKTKYGVETWETINRCDYNSYKEFANEIKNIKRNYSLMGYNLYSSQRKSNN
tara:strand:- start:345 stop:518 length:174 start_codon:yes stop_codon:yes gene_type:complete